GGIAHNHLRDFGLAAEISSEKFLFLNTKKSDNELYYGTAIGSGKITFNGPFSQIDVGIQAKTGKGTRIVIPVSYGENTEEVSFINYIEDEYTSDLEVDIKKLTELRGLQVDMEVDMTQDAEVLLIFDERAGDIIKGAGEGQIKFSISRLGDIEMYGTYQIARGNYLFTLLNVVNKPFTVKQGGTIKWEGDPFNAIIDIEAEYKGLSTSLSNFISEYITQGAGTDVEQEARKAHDVDLIMFLDGPLQQPNINFDIAFPEIDGELRNYTDSKLRIIRQDQAELNRQVFGLMVIGGFLPSGNTNVFAGRGSLIPINTLSEFVSNQLSIYLTELLSEVFTDVGFISGVDFNINYNVYQSDQIDLEGGGRIIRTGSELQLNLNNNLFNDRLSVNLGGNIDWGGGVGSSNGAFLAGDVVIEYVLTKDRRFKVRFYQLTDLTLEGRRNRRGVGFSYRREFDTFREFIHGMKNTARKTIEQTNPASN
ncbi:MAG: translocation/assembly module TamB domain-containing protein, partial [Bacteroidota bacterium]